MPDARYGATVDDVRALLPHRRLDETSKPSSGDVDAYLTRGSDYVAGFVGDATVWGEWAAGHARTLVGLWAASTAEAAAYPEGADRGDAAYANVLWERFRQGLGLFGVDAGGVVIEPPAPPGPADVPAYSFPEPLFTRARGF